MSTSSTLPFNVLSAHFNRALDQRSTVRKDVYRAVNVDSKGNEYVTYPEVDYPKLQQSLGTVDDWSLRSLLKAGISPDFPIRNTVPTRLELESQLFEIQKQLDTLFPVENTIVSAPEDSNSE